MSGDMQTKKLIEGLNIQDLCGLIKACGDARVTSLKWGTLSVEFLPKLEPSEIALSRTTPEAGISEADRQKEQEEQLVRREIELKEQELAEMPIADPLQFEQLQTGGELVNG